MQREAQLEILRGKSFSKSQDRIYDFVNFDSSKLLKKIYMETNASYFLLGIVLLQIENDKKHHLIAFFSKKFQAIEINYIFHDKELLAIVNLF